MSRLGKRGFRSLYINVSVIMFSGWKREGTSIMQCNADAFLKKFPSCLNLFMSLLVFFRGPLMFWVSIDTSSRFKLGRGVCGKYMQPLVELVEMYA